MSKLSEFTKYEVYSFADVISLSCGELITRHDDSIRHICEGDNRAEPADPAFPKKLIEQLKNRATTENTSVNALAERLMESSLQGSAAGEEYLRLVTDPDEAVRQLYRQLILGQTFGAAARPRTPPAVHGGAGAPAYRRGGDNWSVCRGCVYCWT